MEENFNPNLLTERKQPIQPKAAKSLFDDFFAGLGNSDFMKQSNKLIAEGGYVDAVLMKIMRGHVRSGMYILLVQSQQ